MPSSVILRCPSCRTLNRVPQEKLSGHPHCGQCRNVITFPTRPVNATAASFDREVSDWPEAVFVEFWSVTCGYCRMVEPVVNDIAAWRAGRLKVLKVDIQAEFSLAQRYSVMATPTFILFKNGQQVDRIDGAPREKIDLVAWVDRHLS
ncbi:MAG: thioredoxin domain-containing protein [Nitrospiraceae bacterium]|nr:thioredoxin domain-containing protein [Nitrospiraceae bacterium]